MPALTNPGILGLSESETVTIRSVPGRMQSRGRLYRLLLGLCLLVMTSFGLPIITWLGSLGYALIALLLTQLVTIRQQVLSPQDRLYQCLGILALGGGPAVAAHAGSLAVERGQAGAELECAGRLERGAAAGPGTSRQRRRRDGGRRRVSVARSHRRAGDDRC